MQMQPFSGLEEIAGIVRDYENCVSTPDNFHHREHLAVAFWYCRHAPEDKAIALMKQGLLRFIAHHGLTRVYHETITIFWAKRVARFCAEAGPDADLTQLANELLRHNGDPKIIHQYYSPALLNSEAARSYWHEPDRLGVQTLVCSERLCSKSKN